MARGPRINNKVLLRAGLGLMRLNDKPLSRRRSKGRAMLYDLPNGETVPARTCNDHILIAVAKSTENGASLNIEGTDWLLLVMPEVERTSGRVIAYLLPTQEVVDEARRTHQEWLDSNPNTRGNNTTWTLWFRANGPEKASSYADKWNEYRLSGEATTEQELAENTPMAEAPQSRNIKGEVEVARRRIAKVSGVPVEAVKITIDFGI